MKQPLPMYEGASEAVNELLHRFASVEPDALFRVATEMADRDFADCRQLAAHIRALLVLVSIQDAKDRSSFP
ncbi:hypothetical protein GGR76_003100 [Xanthomonas translucens]|nr:hypothetical protein [Xanthomonas campestris]